MMPDVIPITGSADEGMTAMTSRRIWAVAAVSSAMLVLAACSSGDGGSATVSQNDSSGKAVETVDFISADSGPLRILLTNDDGWDAPGVAAMYDALVEAGHDVRLVGPAENYSGVSAAIDFVGEFDVVNPTDDENVYSVSTTPAGTVLFGVEEVFGGDKPDLVISGSNVGANTGFDTNFSGTIGAAVVGSGFFGIPSIAVSTAIERGAEADAAYAETAQVVVDLIDTGVPELDAGAILNINYPLLTDIDEPKGVRYAVEADQSVASFDYERSGDEEFTIVPGRADIDPAADSDIALLADGYVTVTVLTTDRSVAEDDVVSVGALVDALN